MTLAAPTEIGIACRSIDTLLDFYRSAFSFELISRIAVPAALSALTPLDDHGYTVVRLQSPFGERLKLLSPAMTPSRKDQPRPAQNILQAANAVFITFIVDDLSAVRERAIQLGATAMGEAVQVRPELHIAFLQDPEGNYLELAEYADVRRYRGDV